MPRLYGAPAYARPKRSVVIERPFDPDDLPIEANRTAADDAFLTSMTTGRGERDDRRSFLRRALLPFGRPEEQAVESRG
jgi:hypothetical protein